MVVGRTVGIVDDDDDDDDTVSQLLKVVIFCIVSIRCWIHHMIVLVRVGCWKGDIVLCCCCGDGGGCCTATAAAAAAEAWNTNCVLQCCMVYCINCGVVIIPKMA